MFSPRNRYRLTLINRVNGILLIVIGLAVIPVIANENEHNTPSISAPKPAVVDSPPSLPPAATEEVTEVVSQLLEHPDFGGFSPSHRLRLKESDKPNERNIGSNFQKLLDLLSHLGSALRFAIYLLAGCIVVFVVWALLNRLPEHWGLRSRPSSIRYLDVEHHPLTRSLPTDIPSAASQALRLGKPREALSYLYRGALRSVMRRHGFSILESATEQECLRRVRQCQHGDEPLHFSNIVTAWSQVAYAHTELPVSHIEQLVRQWKDWFQDDSAVDAYQPVATKQTAQ